MELPRVRRYRKGTTDRLYVEDADGITYGWADTTTGEITIQIPGSEARVEAAFAAWAQSYPEDDLATHAPGRSTAHLAAAWQAEIDALDEDQGMLQDMRAIAVHQRDQYLKGTSGEMRIGARLNALHRRGWGVLHAIPLYDGRADIDHLLIGSGGIWTINAKAHGALPIRVNGDRMSVGRSPVTHIPAARHEASVVRTLAHSLGHRVPVYAAVALDIHHSTPLKVTAAPTDVVVGRTEDVIQAIHRSEGIVDTGTVHTLFALLRQRSTWEDT